MPSIRYYNQTAPFWDWVASMESGAGEHPFFSAYAAQTGDAQGGSGPRGPPGPDADGLPSPPVYDGAPPPPQQPSGPPPPHEHQHGQQSGSHHREGPPGCNARQRGGCGGRGGWCGRGRHGGPPFGAGFPFGGPHHRGGWGGFGGRGHRGGPFDMNALSQFLSQKFGFDTSDDADGNNATKDKSNNDKDFTPPCDVFDTPEAFVLHISLPGAKKEDVGVNWDADKSEVSVAGVVYRIGDEEMLKTLAMDEREVGVFERKVRLGSRAHPASVDADAVSARMQDGVLIVTVPKVEEFVEVKKVDIE